MPDIPAKRHFPQDLEEDVPSLSTGSQTSTSVTVRTQALHTIVHQQGPLNDTGNNVARIQQPTVSANEKKKPHLQEDDVLSQRSPPTTSAIMAPGPSLPTVPRLEQSLATGGNVAGNQQAGMSLQTENQMITNLLFQQWNQGDSNFGVCREPHRGRYHGLVVCRPCASFFRSSFIYDKIRKYECTNNGKCVSNITEETRNECQKCRLTRCLLLGMHKRNIPGIAITPENKHLIDSILHVYISTLTEKIKSPSGGFLQQQQYASVSNTSTNIMIPGQRQYFLGHHQQPLFAYPTTAMKLQLYSPVFTSTRMIFPLPIQPVPMHQQQPFVADPNLPMMRRYVPVSNTFANTSVRGQKPHIPRHQQQPFVTEENNKVPDIHVLTSVILHAYHSTEPDVRYTSQPTNTDPCQRLMEILLPAVSRFIDFVVHIPDFLKLSIEDQCMLSRDGFLSVMAIRAARHYDRRQKSIITLGGHTLCKGKEQGVFSNSYPIFIQSLFQQVEKIADANMDDTAAALLSAVAIFDVQRRTLNPGCIQETNQKLKGALEHYLKYHTGISNEQKLQEVMMMLEVNLHKIREDMMNAVMAEDNLQGTLREMFNDTPSTTSIWYCYITQFNEEAVPVKSLPVM